MNTFGVTREGNNDEILLKDGRIISLGNIRPEFVRWSNGKYKIVFVGMYTYTLNNDNITIYSLPKYYPMEQCNIENIDNIKSVIVQICKVVEKLRTDNNKKFEDEDYLFNPYEIHNEAKKVNRMELAEFIIDDYLQNGLYVKDMTLIRKNGLGRTSWSKTVSHISPVFQGSDVIYLDNMNKEHIIDEDDIISVIHANVVNQCLEFAGALWNGCINTIDLKENLGHDLSQYTDIINSRSTYVFRERDINLLKALSAWCAQTRYYENYAGVTCFDRVWEWVNNYVWGNLNDIKSGTPTYHISKCDGRSVDFDGTGEAIPDTIRIEKDGVTTLVYVLDSKYYTVKYIDTLKGNLYGYPANSDIVKQIEYLELLKAMCENNKNSAADNRKFIFKNAFLLPESPVECDEKVSENKECIKEAFHIADDVLFKRIGSVEQGTFDSIIDKIMGKQDHNEEIIKNGREVELILINPERLYEKYLNNSSVTAQELKKLFNIVL